MFVRETDDNEDKICTNLETDMEFDSRIHEFIGKYLITEEELFNTNIKRHHHTRHSTLPSTSLINSNSGSRSGSFFGNNKRIIIISHRSFITRMMTNIIEDVCLDLKKEWKNCDLRKVFIYSKQQLTMDDVHIKRNISRTPSLISIQMKNRTKHKKQSVSETFLQPCSEQLSKSVPHSPMNYGNGEMEILKIDDGIFNYEHHKNTLNSCMNEIIIQHSIKKYHKNWKKKIRNNSKSHHLRTYSTNNRRQSHSANEYCSSSDNETYEVDDVCTVNVPLVDRQSTKSEPKSRKRFLRRKRSKSSVLEDDIRGCSLSSHSRSHSHDVKIQHYPMLSTFEDGIQLKMDEKYFKNEKKDKKFVYNFDDILRASSSPLNDESVVVNSNEVQFSCMDGVLDGIELDCDVSDDGVSNLNGIDDCDGVKQDKCPVIIITPPEK